MKTELAGALTLVCVTLALLIGVAFVLPETPLTVISSNLRPYLAVCLIIGSGLLLFAGHPYRAGMFALVGVAFGLQVAGLIVTERGQWDLASGRPSLGQFKILSFNIYNNNEEGGSRIADYVAASGADVAMIMEAGPIEPYLPELAATYPYRVGCGERTPTCDLLILSKRQFLDVEVATLGPISQDRYMEIGIEVDDRRVTLIAAHLVKPYFDGYGWLEVRRLGKKIEEIAGPLVVAGDFNATTWSSTMQLLFERTRLQTGPWPVGTWPAVLGPFGLPIDHVLARDGAHVATKDAIGDAFGSNHRGLISTIVLQP